MKQLTESQRLNATRKIMQAVDDWGLTGEQIIAVLSLPDSQRTRHLQKFRDDTAFPDVEQINVRMATLLGIVDALRTSYPKNLQMGARWMNQPHRRFQKRTPIRTMLEDGDAGVIAVLSELDCAYAWELTGSTRN
ncbi:MAG: MbcA/ParS/Xre antitoxin family protein [Gammaproteobacteria bacterium]|nr:MbcA/ParS/Xre antitoxin family protein [Gammaproteobacteria bacterium]MCW8924490.1 MbcA/ParS/Xre antitoxin family protein [Gammaproteobacteria bacterium]